MKTRNKLSILMVFTVAVPIILCIGITYFFLRNSITEIEVNNSKTKIKNVQNYINSLLKFQQDTLGSWTPWTDFFIHIGERNIEKIQLDLGDTKEDSPTEVLGVLDKNYNPIYISDTAPQEWIQMNFKDASFIKGLNDSTHYYSNIESYREGVYLIGTAKVTHYEDKDFKDFNGYLILARKVNSNMLEAGKDILGINFAIRFENDIFSTDNNIIFLSNSIPKEIQSFSNISSEKMTVVSEAALEDAAGKNIATIHIESISTAGVKALNLLLICFGFILAVTLACSIGVISISIRNSIIKPLNEILDVTQETSKGNFTVKTNYKSDNEIGRLGKGINTMLDNLRKIISKLVYSSEQVASLSEELTANSDENSKSIEDIANTVQEMVHSTIEQSNKVNNASETIAKLSNRIEDIYCNAQSASVLAIKSQDYALEGNKAVHIIQNEINAINKEVLDSAMVVEELCDRLKQIGKILDIIKAIARQTNLLSFNAAIEAARAGENGKGFSVVADEIKNLANKSGNFVQQIEEIVEDIHNRAAKTIESMKRGTEEVNKGTIVVGEAGVAFKNILQSVEKATKQIQDISDLMKDMSRDSKNINLYMNEVLNIANAQSANMQTIAATTEEQSASMQEIASSANTLASMAQELMALVENFNI